MIKTRERAKKETPKAGTGDPRANQTTQPRFYTRAGVREKLDIPDEDLRRLINAGRLRADRSNSGGYALYSEKQVLHLLAMKADGTLLDFQQKAPLVTEPPGSDVPFEREEAIRVFALIKKGTPLQDIVIEAGVDPRVVDRIRFEWDKLSGSMTIPATLLAQINKLHHLPGSFPIRAPSQFIELLDACQQERVCGSCKNRGCASECAICIQARVVVDQAEKHELAVREAIAACIIAIESKPAPKQPWTRDEVVANLRALLMQRATAAASVSATPAVTKGSGSAQPNTSPATSSSSSSPSSSPSQ